MDINQFRQAVTSTAVNLVEQFYGDYSINRTNIQKIIDYQNELLQSDCFNALKENVVALINNEEGRVIATQMFEAFQGIYEPLDSEYKRIKLFKKVGIYIEPRKYFTGPSLQYGTSGDAKPVDLTGYYVPMEDTLKTFLELPNVLNTILEYMEELGNRETTIVENLVQCSLWNKKIKPSFGDKIVLPINIFADAFEPCNPIGTKAGTHSVTGVYFDLPCIPQRFRGKLNNIFAVAIFYATDKFFGTREIYRPILEALKKLENEGIEVCCKDKKIKRVYFALVSIIGDNLGISEALGLTTGFSGNHVCRICTVHKQVMRKQTKLDYTLLRTKENYEEHLSEIADDGQMSRGVKEPCIWNELKSFHLVENVAIDLPHDLAEGVCKYVMIPLIKCLIKNGRITLTILNNRMEGFNFGSIEVSNKPPPITQAHLDKKTLHFSASQMICFVRYFGLMIGDLIPVREEKEIWRLWRLLCKIIDIVYAPFIDLNMRDILRNLITQHHELFLKLFPEKWLQLKFHLMLHYPDIISTVGPLSLLSGMRFEAKHKLFKQIANLSNNFRSLPQTLLKREQLRFAARLLRDEGLDIVIEGGKIRRNLDIKEIDNSPEFLSIIPPLMEEVISVKKVTAFGTKYDLTMTLLINLNDDFPVFGEIKYILIDGKDPNKVYFVGKEFIVDDFDQHYHAFRGQRSSKWFFISYEELVSFYPTHIRTAVNGKLYATYRHIL